MIRCVFEWQCWRLNTDAKEDWPGARETDIPGNLHLQNVAAGFIVILVGTNLKV